MTNRTTGAIDHLHLIFKTHLDLGFTNLARVVVKQYMEEHIPRALRIARTLREQESSYRFIWTTGSWLIDTFLERAPAESRREMETAILAGDIVWHALPFTLHSELLDAELFAFGLGISQRLDRRFGRQTIAAKMTDVPGHTRAIVPLLAEAGVEFLHIGINEASPMPDVPPLFMWVDEASGQRIAVMYHASYGEETVVPAAHTGLVVFSTGDNIGPHSVAQVQQGFDHIATRFPDASLSASTLDAFARDLRLVRDTLPVVTSEIGDAWIHGVGTDPQKVRQFRALSRLRRQWLGGGQARIPETSMREFSANLLCVAEHTWGLDSKMHIRDNKAFEAQAFAAARTQPDMHMMESSWQEQRNYVKAAVDALKDTVGHAAALAAIQATPPETALGRIVSVTAENGSPVVYETPQFDIAFDPRSGAICHLRSRVDGRLWADADHPLGLLQYQTFSYADYMTFWSEFIRNADQPDVRAWAIYDYTRTGIDGLPGGTPLTPYALIALRTGITAIATRLSLTLESEPDLAVKYGAPARVQLDITCAHDRPHLEIRLTWAEKAATRFPEAAWLSFVPIQLTGATWRFEKMGRPIDVLNVASRGNRALHAVNDRIFYRDENASLTLTTPDAPLVAPGEPGLLRFADRVPDMRKGIHINLFNNVWNTNFPLWLDGPAEFRFALEFDE